MDIWRNTMREYKIRNVRAADFAAIKNKDWKIEMTKITCDWCCKDFTITSFCTLQHDFCSIACRHEMEDSNT